MKKIILVGGDLAAGKTTFAKKIAHELNLIVLNKDTIKEILGDNIGFKDRAENLRLSYATFELFKYLAKEFMEKEISFILESNFRERELRYLEELTNEYHYQAISFILTGDISILHQRFMDRIASKTRNIVHQAVDLSSEEDFRQLILEARKVTYFGTIYKIDTTNLDIDYPKIIEMINQN